MKNPQRLPTQDCPRLEVNLQALAHNWQTVNAAYRGRHVGAVVKYDAYGLGMAAVAQTLWQQGCRNFWVENMDEALLLRSQLRGNSVRIFVLGGLAGLGANAAGEYAAHGLIPVLTGAEELAALGGFARRHGQRLPIACNWTPG